MLSRTETLRPYILVLTVPATLLWSRALGPVLGPAVIVTHACSLLFLSAWWVRRDLARGMDPRLGLVRDRFGIDRETLEIATPLFGLVTAALVIVLLGLRFWLGLYAAFVIAAGIWHAGLGPAKRFVMLESVVPVAFLIGPAMLLRAPAWRGEPAGALGSAALAGAWLIGAGVLITILAAMTRDRDADRAAGVVTTASRLSRPAAIALLVVWSTAVTLLAGIGAAAGWWGIAAVVFTGWTGTAVVAFFCARWDSWGVTASMLGYSLTAVAVAVTAF